MGKQFSEILNDRLCTANINVSPDLLSKFNLLPRDKQNFILRWNFGALASFEDFMCTVDDENVGRFESYVLKEEGAVYLIIGMDMRVKLDASWIPAYEEYDCVKQEWHTVLEYPVTQDFASFIRKGNLTARAVLCDAVKSIILAAISNEKFGEWRTPLTRLKDLSLYGLHKFLACFYEMVGKLPAVYDWGWVYGDGISYSEVRTDIMPDIIFRAETNIGVVISGNCVYVQDLSGYTNSWVLAKVTYCPDMIEELYGTLIHALSLCGMYLTSSGKFMQLLRQWRVMYYFKCVDCAVVDLTVDNLSTFVHSSKLHSILKEM